MPGNAHNHSLAKDLWHSYQICSRLVMIFSNIRDVSVDVSPHRLSLPRHIARSFVVYG